MRRDAPEVIELLGASELPADPSTIVAALDPWLTEERRARIATVIAARTRSVVPVLDGLIDPHNVAAVLRSADAFGLQEVHLLAGPEAFVASKRIAQGTERWIDVLRHESPGECVRALRARGHRVYVAAMDGAVQPSQLAAEPRVAVVFGNEHAGVSDEMRDLADGTYTIPMRGFVQSLNVSVAAAITLFAATQGRAGDLGAQERELLLARYLLASVPRAIDLLEEHLRRRGA
jgi:tRNA (guanosine-2'-O-)-methyltransferase